MEQRCLKPRFLVSSILILCVPALYDKITPEIFYSQHDFKLTSKNVLNADSTQHFSMSKVFDDSMTPRMFESDDFQLVAFCDQTGCQRSSEDPEI